MLLKDTCIKEQFVGFKWPFVLTYKRSATLQSDKNGTFQNEQCVFGAVMSKLPVTWSQVCVFGCHSAKHKRKDELSRWNLKTESPLSALSLWARAALIQGGGRPAARAGVNRGIIGRHAPLNGGLYCWSRVGQQLQTGLELAADNNGAAVLLFREQASAPHLPAVKHHKTMQNQHRADVAN